LGVIVCVPCAFLRPFFYIIIIFISGISCPNPLCPNINRITLLGVLRAQAIKPQSATNVGKAPTSAGPAKSPFSKLSAAKPRSPQAVTQKRATGDSANAWNFYSEEGHGIKMCGTWRALAAHPAHRARPPPHRPSGAEERRRWG
jgi:hypothetical protein